MRILFLHGWTSTPGGLKPTYLKSHGHEVLNPALPDDDFDIAVSISQQEFDRGHPDVVVGSSRGGAVAMNIDCGDTPLVLLCPAWKRWGAATTVKPGTLILHSPADDVVPFTDSQELLRNSGLPESALIVVGTDHRLADPEPLEAMLIASEWASLRKDWYSIYQWPRTKNAGHLDWVASLILASIGNIELVTTGLRQGAFRVPNHRGQAKLQTDIAQFTEKRFCRAMFNLSVATPLGTVIDYEVPLKRTQDAPHGDIDLLCVNAGAVVFLEAKQPSSNESILKAILEAFVYSSLVATVRQPFLDCFSLPRNSVLAPAVLTFSNALSGRQLAIIESLPRLLEVIRTLNDKLRHSRVSPLRFFFVQNDNNAADGCLMIECCPNGDKKVVFRDGYVPTIVECVVQ